MPGVIQMLKKRWAYAWSNTNVKEKVGLSAGGLYGGGGLIGGEIR